MPDVHGRNFGADHSAKAHALWQMLLALFGPTTAVRNLPERGVLVNGGAL